MFVGDGAIRQEVLREVDIIDIIDGYLGRHVGLYRTERKSGGVNDHGAVESGVEGVAGAKYDGYFVTGFACRIVRFALC